MCSDTFFVFFEAQCQESYRDNMQCAPIVDTLWFVKHFNTHSAEIDMKIHFVWFWSQMPGVFRKNSWHSSRKTPSKKLLPNARSFGLKNSSVFSKKWETGSDGWHAVVYGSISAHNSSKIHPKKSIFFLEAKCQEFSRNNKQYGVATISRLLSSIGLFCRTSSIS